MPGDSNPCQDRKFPCAFSLINWIQKDLWPPLAWPFDRGQGFVRNFLTPSRDGSEVHPGRATGVFRF